MLKIKDDVDLKELEKFGFKKTKQNDEYADYVKYVYECCSNEYITIFKDNTINLHTNGWKMEAQEILFDLIQAGLVEKVADNET